MTVLPALLRASQARFSEQFSLFLAQQNALDTRLINAIQYAMQNGGKRVRPALAWGACLAVGGDWPGAPDNATQFPQRFLVDFVRVYSCSAKNVEGWGCATLPGNTPAYAPSSP